MPARSKSPAPHHHALPSSSSSARTAAQQQQQQQQQNGSFHHNHNNTNNNHVGKTTTIAKQIHGRHSTNNKRKYITFIATCIMITLYAMLELHIHKQSGFPIWDRLTGYRPDGDATTLLTYWKDDDDATWIKSNSWFVPLHVQGKWGMHLSFNNTYQTILSRPRCGCSDLGLYLKRQPIICSSLPHCLSSATNIVTSTFNPTLWPILKILPYSSRNYIRPQTETSLVVMLDGQMACNLTLPTGQVVFSGTLNKNAIVRIARLSILSCTGGPALMLELSDPTPRWTRGQFLLDVIDRIGNLLSKTVTDDVHFDDAFSNTALFCPPGDGKELLSFWESFVHKAAAFVATQTNSKGWFDGAVSRSNPVSQFSQRATVNFEKILRGSAEKLDALCIFRASLALLYGKEATEAQTQAWHVRVVEATIDARRRKLYTDVQNSVAFDGSGGKGNVGSSTLHSSSSSGDHDANNNNDMISWLWTTPTMTTMTTSTHAHNDNNDVLYQHISNNTPRKTT